jgi:hypothetical protein
MPSVVQQWKDWYSGAYDPPQYIAGYGNFWLNTVTKGVWGKNIRVGLGITRLSRC